jgi:hypothetical protein
MNNYSKPEVLVLGEAAEVIQVLGKIMPGPGDTQFTHRDPAYDLDE